jgi:hypothetical protein
LRSISEPADSPEVRLPRDSPDSTILAPWTLEASFSTELNHPALSEAEDLQTVRAKIHHVFSHNEPGALRL